MIKRKPFKKSGGRIQQNGHPLPKKRLKRLLGGKNKALPSISKLIKACDAQMSKNVREANADKEGICTCYTCGYRAPIKRVQAGHLTSRWYKAVRWHKNNVRVQCWVCNIYKKGDSTNFRRRLIQEIGKEAVEEMEELAQKDTKLSREFLEEKLQKLKAATPQDTIRA